MGSPTSKINGGVIGVNNAATLPAAPGVWSVPCAMAARSQNKWPTFIPSVTADFLIIAGGGSGGAERRWWRWIWWITYKYM